MTTIETTSKMPCGTFFDHFFKSFRKSFRKKMGACGTILCLIKKTLRKPFRNKLEAKDKSFRIPQTYIVCGCGMIFLYACRA